MNNELYNEKTLSAFLLGALSAEEQEALELALLEDAQLQQQLQDAEYDLADDYVRGELSDEESAQFEQHFLQSSARRKLLVTAQALDEKRQKVVPEKSEEQAKIPNVIPFSAKPKAPKNFTWNYAWRLAASIAVIGTLGFFAWKTWYKGSLTEQGLATLQQAWRHERPLESRVSGFGYAPFVQTRGAGDSPKNSILREQAGSELRRAIIETPNSSSQHALGTYYLHEQKFTEAIVQLEAALKAEPKNAQLHNDLGAALLELARQQKQASERSEKSDPQTPGSLKTFAQANEHFAQALQLNPQFAEAIFNQSLSLQELGLINQSIESWQKYLQLDSRSEWANEARRKLKELEEQKQRIAYHPEKLHEDFLIASVENNEVGIWQSFNLGREQYGNLITTRLLDEYLKLQEEGNFEAAQQRLELIANVGQIELNRSRDSFTRDLVMFYRNSSVAQRRHISVARTLFKKATAVAGASWQEGLEFSRQARIFFVEADDQLEALLTDILVCTLQMRQAEYAAAKKTAEAIAHYAVSHNYHWLQAQALGLLRGLYSDLTEFSTAIKYGEQALKYSSFNTSNIDKVGNLWTLADIYLFSGDYEISLPQLQRCLTLVTSSPQLFIGRWGTYRVTSRGLNGLGFPYTAISYEKEALTLALESNRSLNVSRSYDTLGELYGSLNKMNDAQDWFERSLAIGNAMTDEQLGKDIKAHALLRLGHIYRISMNPERAIQSYQESIKICDEMGILDENFVAHRGKLMAHLMMLDQQAAEQELAQTLKIFEANRLHLNEDSLRTTYFDAGQGVYDLATKFSLDFAKDSSQAFTYTEMGRARTLAEKWERLGRSNQSLKSTEPLKLPSLQKQLPLNVQLIEYTVLQDALVIWIISDRIAYSAISKVSLNELNVLINDYLRQITSSGISNQQATNLLAQKLYNVLIAPVSLYLDEKKEICIIPDKILNYLSFAGLIDQDSGKYLIERFALSYNPSAKMLIQSSDALSLHDRNDAEKCLSIGNPSFDRQHYSTLPELVSARLEAEQIASFYTHPRVLLNTAASESRVRDELPSANVLHIAAHGITNQSQPDFSGLLLADEPDNSSPQRDGILQVREISQMKLPHLNLVILSACQSGLGKNYHGEGIVGLRHAFLALGVPQVISSFWLVNSETTQELMKNFHYYRTRQGLTNSNALRQAQLEMLRRPEAHYRHPYAWSAFSLTGGTSQL